MSETHDSQRLSGVLLHPTSLPGGSGIGDIGLPAMRFIEFLADAGQRLWQVCPLGPTGFGDSPYQCFSAFAGNPLLIGFEPLVEQGLLVCARLDDYPKLSEKRVDYGRVIKAKTALLAQVCSDFEFRADRELKDQYQQFVADNTFWLEDYALFTALKEAYDGQVWSRWPKPLAMREPEALERARDEHRPIIERARICQFLFFHQWNRLRQSAADRDIRMIGDAPIFVAYDSADVWSRPEQFFLDDNGQPTVVAGVPPDYFSKTGQLWGNPLYRWKVMKADGYRWWIERIRAQLAIFDLIRLDHFRGFEAYWQTPAEAKTAETGRWVRGPGADFFEHLEAELGHVPIIAEDLGVITPRVDALRERFGLPGMKVLQFAFGGDAHNQYLPHNHEPNFVVYTGTHDNDTTRGWYAHAQEHTRDHARRYLWSDGSSIHLDMIRAALMSPARIAIVPLQDILGLGSEARLNMPGAAQGNWQWRFGYDQLSDEIAGHLKNMVDLYGRGQPPQPYERDPNDPTPDPDQALEAPD